MRDLRLDKLVISVCLIDSLPYCSDVDNALFTRGFNRHIRWRVG